MSEVGESALAWITAIFGGVATAGVIGMFKFVMNVKEDVAVLKAQQQVTAADAKIASEVGILNARSIAQLVPLVDQLYKDNAKGRDEFNKILQRIAVLETQFKQLHEAIHKE